MNRQEHFLLKKTVELKCQIDLKTIIFAGIRHGDPQHFEPDSQSCDEAPGVSVASVPAWVS